MKLLYCHDNVYLHSELGEIYSQGQFPYSYFDPFINSFDDITVVARGVPLDHNLNLKKLNVSSGPSLNFELLPNINSINGLLKHYRDVNQRLKQQVAEADAVVIRAVSDLGWLTYKHARAMNKPIGMEMSACAWDSTWNHGNPYGRIYAPIRHIRDKIITKNADCVIYVSQTFLQKRYPATGDTAISSNVRIQLPDESVLERRLDKIKAHSEEDVIVIGLIGHLGNRLKGIDSALRALHRIEQKRPGRFIFKILGPGSAKHYQDMAKDLGIEYCVVFEGIIQSGEKVLEWLDNIDIYIQPSFQEGVPRATIEAMSRGCACIGSSAGGIPELLPKQWLHKPGDDKRLEDLLIKMMKSSDERTIAATQNFNTSKLYTSEKLLPIRQKFWQKFFQRAQKNKQA